MFSKEILRQERSCFQPTFPAALPCNETSASSQRPSQQPEAGGRERRTGHHRQLRGVCCHPVARAGSAACEPRTWMSARTYTHICMHVHPYRHAHTYLCAHICLHFTFTYLQRCTPESPVLFIALGYLETVRSIFQSGRQSSTHAPTPASTSSMWEAITWVTATTAAQGVWVVGFFGCFS